jgi:hypothetical protein
VLVSLPGIVYNLVGFGDPFAWTLVLSVSPTREHAMTFDDWLFILRGLYTSFWGRFGGVIHLTLPDAVYITLGLLFVLPVLGWVRLFLDARRRDSTPARLLLGFFGAFWLVLLVAHWRWTTIALGTDQARLLFPGLPLLAIVVIYGLAQLFKPHERAAVAISCLAVLAATLGSLFFLLRTYSPPQQPQVALSPSQVKELTFGDTIRILDLRLDRTSAAPGETIQLQVMWEAVSAPAESYWMLLQVVGDGDPVATVESVPSAGRLTTDWWQAGQRLSSRHRIVISPEAPPGDYSLTLGLHPFGRWEWLPVLGQDVAPLARITVTPAP